MIPALWNLSKREFDAWTFQNNLEHARIIQAIAARGGGYLNTYPIYPVAREGFQDFLNWHQQMHNDMNATLGLPGNDLTSLDLDDPNEVATWAFLHVQEHIAASEKVQLT